MEEQMIITKTGSIREIIKNEISKGFLEFGCWLETMKVDEEKILTRDETVRYLGISSSTLYRWTKESKIQAYGIGDRIYYKLSDIKSALRTIN